MRHDDDLFKQYELLLPARNDGGLLILDLYGKIARKEIPEYFSDSDIKVALEDIGQHLQEPVLQIDRVLRVLNNYYIRSVPDQFGLYYLSDYAKRIIKLISNKLRNPYKHFPLKETFDKYFTITYGNILTITDLQTRFGQGFVDGHKAIIEDHLDGLQDEMQEAHQQLSQILELWNLPALQMVNKFVATFRRFGERAEDIGNAISSKDRFLRLLKEEVDGFYQLLMVAPAPENETQTQEVNLLNSNWQIATDIYEDLSVFFSKVDVKLAIINRQILYASDKLTELQENFNSRSNFRLAIKKLLVNKLDIADYYNESISFPAENTAKTYPFQKNFFFYPEYYGFQTHPKNLLVAADLDPEYERTQREIIEQQADQLECINNWVQDAKKRLDMGEIILINDLIGQVLLAENNTEIALYTAFDLMQSTFADPAYTTEIKQVLENIEQINLQLWKIQISSKNASMNS